MELNWRKSSYTSQQGGDCVEVAWTQYQVYTRDSKHPELGHLDLPTREWSALLHAVRTGEV
ncbi:DUF397 domain-containing protein [Lipingzhangella sp. LS1_29]|uniref:DUF397 domain-containing protein n=1 Tax=Lipingzhangella rawalii TaxID=2055835 RepID=A0ABU2HDM6_9ACTN|nr:DUF397 domain-containing protein [Lipingzhangella rawalii]MDS1272674.1 DUF397 domain-containing protein [Lipingzhangella rawalii]